MTSLVANRVQSAHSRPAYRSEITNGQDSLIKQRPTTSVGAHRQRYTNGFDQAAIKTLESANLSSTPSRYRRPKTASSTTSGRSALVRKLRADEVDSLLRSLDRNDEFIVDVDCLGDYQKLVETIDLRRTPIDCQLLCALQQRENRIIQRNACRDIRFRSLIDLLQPKHLLTTKEEREANEATRNKTPDYPPYEIPYEYTK